jgi:hypothetical protein
MVSLRETFTFQYVKVGKTVRLGEMPTEPKVDSSIGNFRAFVASGD